MFITRYCICGCPIEMLTFVPNRNGIFFDGRRPQETYRAICFCPFCGELLEYLSLFDTIKEVKDAQHREGLV